MTLAHVARARSRARAATMYHAAGPGGARRRRAARVEAHAARHGWPLVRARRRRARRRPLSRQSGRPLLLLQDEPVRAHPRGARRTPSPRAPTATTSTTTGPGCAPRAEHDVVHPYVEAGDRQGRRLRARRDASGSTISSGCPRSRASRAASRPASPSTPPTSRSSTRSRPGSRRRSGARRCVRCRVTHAGVVIELGDARRGERAARRPRDRRARLRGEAGRAFAGVRAVRARRGVPARARAAMS